MEEYPCLHSAGSLSPPAYVREGTLGPQDIYVICTTLGSAIMRHTQPTPPPKNGAMEPSPSDT